MVKVGTLVLFLTLGEMLSIFTIEDNVCCGFVIYSFYYVEVCSFYSCFLESFYHKWVLNFVKAFSASIEIITCFLSFNLLMQFIIYSFYFVEVCSCYSCFLESFYHKWMLNFVKGFPSACIEIIIWLLSFNLLMWCIMLINL